MFLNFKSNTTAWILWFVAISWLKLLFEKKKQTNHRCPGCASWPLGGLWTQLWEPVLQRCNFHTLKVTYKCSQLSRMYVIKMNYFSTAKNVNVCDTRNNPELTLEFWNEEVHIFRLWSHPTSQINLAYKNKKFWRLQLLRTAHFP